MSAFVTDDEYDRARSEPDFRQKLLMEKLDLLLEEIAKLRQRKPASGSPEARFLREGVDLAVQVADVLQKGARPAPHRPGGSEAA
ncbi:MAG: hypothetical protein J0H78_01070 [Rhizobiales bacterium]|nr:hypothetical protein [Hyphomicrobiales bacterium]MBX3554443.1 hypothetical protein [Pseudolabrys sp.]MCW5685059.1 hypothetical protein [Pseudolabrys sp.]OJY46076.1 MAG: hypothetical protein BGP08_06985 [Rhizobiales bacterium 64-17]